MPFMWADTLLVSERAHLLRLLAWAASSVLLGTALLSWLLVGARRSALLRHFAIQTAAWGAVELTLVALSWASLGTRDLSGATRLDRFLWFTIGLDAGFVLLGVALALCGWKIGRRLGLVGAGLGILVQGVGLALMDLLLAVHISR